MITSLTPNSADALLFDIGRVVLDFDIQRTASAWAERAGSTPAEMMARFVGDETFWRYETGHINDEEFFGLVRQSLGVTLSDAELLAGWNNTFIGEMPGITPLLARAAQHVPLYAFSNTNTAHVAYFSQHYVEPLSHFREIFLSSTIQLRKPHAEAYRHVIAAIGVPAERIVFFDDLADNIEGARACGLQAIHVTSPTSVAEALKALGI
jgi:putative hydrolase of the HAD superfamily